MIYNWQHDDWPNFRYELSNIDPMLFLFAEKSGHISGILKALPKETQDQTIIQFMVTEAIKTSEIEGEYISRQDVMSSICHHLGVDTQDPITHDKRAQGAAKLMIMVRDDYVTPLSNNTLLNWHHTLMQGAKHIEPGQWRTHKEAMQVISGRADKTVIHFEAPPSDRIPSEMEVFITWFNQSAPGKTGDIKQAAIRSAIAHLYFETIHPFEDGNGRIGRAISEKALWQGLGGPTILSLSKTIEANKKSYYKALENAQKSNNITAWIDYFVTMIFDAQCDAERIINFTLQKAHFFDHYKDQFTARHIKVLSRMLEEGPDGFKGGMNAKKYMALTSTSKATATRDLQNLSNIGALKQTGAGRSTYYQIQLII